MRTLIDLFEDLVLWVMMKIGRWFVIGMMEKSSSMNAFLPKPGRIGFYEDVHYIDNHNHSHGSWRFILKNPIVIDLWLYAGAGIRVPIAGPGKVIHFIDQDGETRATMDNEGKLVIREGYAWDGCTPKWWSLGRWWGTPDPQWSRLASLVHDVLYQFGNTPHFIFRREHCDVIFYNLMVAGGANPHTAGTYYGAVKSFGCRFFRNNRSTSIVKNS